MLLAANTILREGLAKEEAAEHLGGWWRSRQHAARAAIEHAKGWPS